MNGGRSVFIKMGEDRWLLQTPAQVLERIVLLIVSYKGDVVTGKAG